MNHPDFEGLHSWGDLKRELVEKESSGDTGEKESRSSQTTDLETETATSHSLWQFLRQLLTSLRR